MPQGRGRDHPQDRAGTEQEEAQARERCHWDEGRQRHHSGGDEAGDRPEPDHGAEGEALHHPGREQRADHHADAVHRKRRADTGRRQAEPAHRVGHEHREQQEGAGVEDELGDEHRSQQRVVEHEGRAFFDFMQRMTGRRDLACRLVDAREQHHRDDGEHGGTSERRCRAHPADQHAAERGAGGKRDGACKLDPRVRRWQQFWRDQRGNQGGRCHAIGHRAANGGETEHSKQRQGEPAEPDQGEDREQRHRAQGLRARHQNAPRDAVGEQAGRDREQDERQG